MPSKHKKKHNKSATPQAQAGAPKPPPSSAVTPDVHLTSEQSVPSPPRPPDVTVANLIAESQQPGEMSPSNTNVIANVVAVESPVITAVRTLLNVIEKYNGSTVNGLINELKSTNAQYSEKYGSKIQKKCRLAVSSACAQFIRYATLTLSSIEAEDVSKCRQQMLNEGSKYLRSCEKSNDKIARWAVTLIFDGARILVHSDSLVVLETLKSVPKNIYFSVYIVLDNDTVSAFFKDNYNIDVKIIRDAEVGTLMESMDLVMVGAEAVLKNGGIINKVGTLPLAICAREMNKPMYVLAESFKFSLMYPMSQSDLPKEIREVPDTGRIRVDYTLPKYITFLVTDRGLLTPTAVCDELIELYT